MFKHVALVVLAIMIFGVNVSFAYSPAFLASAQELIIELEAKIKELQLELAKLKAKEIEVSNQITFFSVQLKFTKNLQRGMSGEEVRALQEFLKALPGIYPEGLVTGYFGELTEKAVKKWQTEKGIEAIGIFGPKTRLSFNILITSTSTPAISTTMSTSTSAASTTTSTATATTTIIATTATSTDNSPTATSTTSGDAGAGSSGTNAGTNTTSSTSDTTAPVISSVQSALVTSEYARITWTTNEGAIGKLYFSPGDQSFSTSSTLDLYSGYSTSHFFELSGLNSATTYYYEAVATDASGNTATSNAYNFTTSVVVSTSTPDTTAPTISSVASASITATAATITWTTNESADSQVEYGLTTGYGNSTTLDSGLTTSHSVGLTGLTSGATYHYRVKSRDASSNLATGSDNTFTTSAADTTAPTISSVSSASVTDEAATITWTTDEAATGQVYLSPNEATFSSTTALVSSLSTGHTFTLSGLTSSTLYYYRAVSADAAGNTTTSSSYTFTTTASGGATNTPDTTAPVLSSVQAISPTSSSVTITWSTDEAASSQVEYGLTASYGSATTLDSSLATSHSVGVTGLSAATTYHYRAKSTDAAGNVGNSSDGTFETSASASSTPDIHTGTGVTTTPYPGGIFSVGIGNIWFTDSLPGVSGYIYSGRSGTSGSGKTSPEAFFANFIVDDPYEGVSGASYTGISNICQFTSASNYSFTNGDHEIRIYDASSPYHQGILLFTQNGKYGGLRADDVDSSGHLHYTYWYDASGGSDFSSLCQ